MISALLSSPADVILESWKQTVDGKWVHETILFVTSEPGKRSMHLYLCFSREANQIIEALGEKSLWVVVGIGSVHQVRESSSAEELGKNFVFAYRVLWG